MNMARFYHILNSAMSTGEYERVGQGGCGLCFTKQRCIKITKGIFENYLDIKFRDPNLEAVSAFCVERKYFFTNFVFLLQMSEIQDWFLFQDQVLHQVHSKQEYTLYSYLPYLSVSAHFLFAIPSSSRIQFPHTHSEVKKL